MRISKYGVTLVRLTRDDLELVRHWRNDDEIKKYMNFQDYITPEMQEKWFDSINNPENFYYIIKYKGDKIGLVNDKNIDWKARTAEGGLFLWDKRYINTIVPMKISFLLLEIAYIMLGWNKTFIKVRRDNPRAIEYNRTFGYEISAEPPGQNYLVMELDKKHFFERAEKLRRLIIPDSDGEKMVIVFEEEDELNGTRETVENIIKLAPSETELDNIEIRYC